MEDQFTTYIDFKDDFENGGLFQKEQSLIHRKQMAEICDIIKKRMALERYDPTNHFVSMSDVVDALYTNGDKSVITDDIKKELDSYYSQWGCK